MILIILIFGLSQRSEAFGHERLSGDLNKHLYSLVQKAKTAEDHKLIDSLMNKKQRLSLACEIELRDRLYPKNCELLLKLWEKSLKIKNKNQYESLQALKENLDEQITIENYILRRNKSGTESE